MSSTAAQATSAAPASGAKGAPAPPPAAPFRAGTFRTLSTDGYTNSVTLGAATEDYPVYTPTPNAFLRGLWLVISAATAGNAAATAFNPDAPLNSLSSVTFQDANEKPIVGPFDSYTLMVVNKFGGYQNLGDPRASAVYSAVTGAGATGGSYAYILYVPLEVADRDALGALQNKSSSSTFQLLMTANTSAAIYATAPTTLPAQQVTIVEDGWVQPKTADATGNPLAQAPPQLGTTQYWTRGTYNGLDGSQQIQLTQGLGYPIRNFIAVNYDVTAGTRSAGDTDWPSPAQFLYKGTSMWNVTSKVWKDQMSRLYGYSSVTADTADGLENGVYVLPFCHDFSNAPGDELRNAYLPTQQGDQFQLIGSFSGNSKLYWLANYVAPVAGPSNLASIRAGG